MFTGIQEILVLVIIAVLVFVLPRMFSRNQPRKGVNTSIGKTISLFSGRMRLAIIVSVMWPALAAVYLKPWSDGLDSFLFIGTGPVLLGWGIRWVIAGFRKDKK